MVRRPHGLVLRLPSCQRVSVGGSLVSPWRLQVSQRVSGRGGDVGCLSGSPRGCQRGWAGGGGGEGSQYQRGRRVGVGIGLLRRRPVLDPTTSSHNAAIDADVGASPPLTRRTTRYPGARRVNRRPETQIHARPSPTASKSRRYCIPESASRANVIFRSFASPPHRAASAKSLQA